MTNYQAIALRFPAYFSIECAHPRFCHVMPYGSLVLTVNTGYE